MKIRNLVENAILGPMEKGMELAKLHTPPKDEVDGVNLKVLPKYICFRAAVLREKLSLQFLLILITTAGMVSWVTSRLEISRLHQQLRMKEYILAPGVQDFTPVSPQQIPESHIRNAAVEFLNTFGNFTPLNIDEQYGRLAEEMSPQLRTQFEVETASWKKKVKEDGISQILTITDREIKTDHGGYYLVTAFIKKDTFVHNEHLGSVDQTIEMTLKLIPPGTGKRWFLQIEELTTHDQNAFRVKSSLTQSSAPSGVK